MQAGPCQFEMKILVVPERNQPSAKAMANNPSLQLQSALEFLQTMIALQPSKNLPVIEEAL